MHTLRLLLYFVLGVFLSAIVTLSYAVETTPSITGSTSRSTDTGCPVTGATVADVCAQAQSCSSIGGHSLAYWNGSLVPMLASADNPYQGFCMDATSTVSAMQVAQVGGVKTCPDSSWTLSADQTTCTRPDCAAGQTRDENGVCQTPTCNVAANSRVGASRYQFPYPQPSGVTWCVQGCEVYPDAVGSNTVGSTMYAYALVNGAGGAASTCKSSGTTIPTPASPIGTTTPTPCTPQQGSISDSTGKVVCVDPTTPGATVPAVQSSSSKKSSFPDGSSSTVTTTNTCTGDGACSTTTTTTVTGVGGGGMAGQAGTPGTTTTTDDKQKSDTSEFCAKNPSLQMCKGGMAEEGTQKQVLAEVKKLSTVDASTDKTAITNAGKYEETPGYQAAKDADDNLVKYASGVTKNADVEASKTTFEQALSSGFWTDIPTASCTTPTYVIAGHEIEWDRWCEIVGYIQDVGAYGMWIMLAISVFVMLTGGRQS